MGLAMRQGMSVPRAANHGPGDFGKSAGWSRRREVVGVMMLLLVAVAVRLPTMTKPLLEQHSYRQTQTAYTAVLYHEEGVDLLRPKVPIFGAPFVFPMEFPLFQSLAAGVMSWGLSPDTAMRVTAFACFLLSALLLWGLVRHVGGRVAAMATLALYLFSPFALQWSRASLMEYLAVAGALGWLWAGLLWRERRRFVYAAAALAAGVIAMLVKPTTGAFWILPLLAYATATEGQGWRSWVRERIDPVLAALVVIPFLAAMAWTRHADAIKAANEATVWLTSSHMTSWNFGTLPQRLVWANWATVGRRVTHDLGFPIWLLPLAPLVGVRTRSVRFWAAFALVPVLTVLTFWNLYVEHTYYLAALSPVAAAVVGCAFARAGRQLGQRRRLPMMVGVWIVALLALNPLLTTLPYGTRSVEENIPMAAELTRLTTPADLIAFEAASPDPTLQYYSRRRGQVILDSGQTRVTAAGLAQTGYRILATPRLRNQVAVDTIRAGRWTGVLGRWVYITGDSQADLRGAAIAATDIPVQLEGSLLAAPVTIVCGKEPVAIPRSDGTTVLRLAPGTARSAKLSISDELGAIPVRDSIVVAPTVDRGPLVVQCRDAVAVTIAAAGAGTS